MADDVTVSILREIRDSIRTLDTNLSARIDATNERIDRLDARLSARIDGVIDRVDVLNERVGVIEVAVRDVASQVLLLTRYFKNKTEVEVEDLKIRVTKLETKVG